MIKRRKVVNIMAMSFVMSSCSIVFCDIASAQSINDALQCFNITGLGSSNYLSTEPDCVSRGNTGNECYDLMHAAEVENACSFGVRIAVDKGSYDERMYIQKGARQKVTCLQSQNGCSAVRVTIVGTDGTRDPIADPPSAQTPSIPNIELPETPELAEPIPVPDEVPIGDDRPAEKGIPVPDEMPASDNAPEAGSIPIPEAEDDTAPVEEPTPVQPKYPGFCDAASELIESCVIQGNGCSACGEPAYLGDKTVNCSTVDGLASALSRCTPVCGLEGFRIGGPECGN